MTPQPHRDRPWRRRALALGVIAAFAALPLSLAGCADLRDGLAGAIGAPTSDEVSALHTQAGDLRRQIAELTALETAARHEQARQEAARGESDARAAQLRQTLARVTTEMSAADLPAAAYEQLRQVAADLQAQLEAVLGQGDARSGMAARYQAQAARLAAQAEQSRQDLAQAQALLDGADAHTAAAIARVGDATRQVGAAASAFGAPGAGLLADPVANLLMGALGTLLTGGWAVSASRKARSTQAAAAGVVRSIDAAYAASPEFRAGWDAAEKVIDGVQSATPGSKALVNAAQGR